MLRILLLLLVTSTAIASEKLIVLGGSDEIPKEAVTRFAGWSGGKDAKVLIIPWATEGTDYARVIRKQIQPHTNPHAFSLAPAYPMTPGKKKVFLKQLNAATGVFFTGGDQARILEIVEDKEIKDALVKKFKAGTPFAGTSAGTAVMSKIMIVGEKEASSSDKPDLVTGTGFCFLPEHVIVDQHFIIRNREARLKLLVMANPGTIGVGIDEPAGFIVEDGIGKVVGGQVVVLNDKEKLVLNEGQEYDLNKLSVKKR